LETGLDAHNEQADRYPLAVLVWGPAAGDSMEYRKRCEIRDVGVLRGIGARTAVPLAALDCLRRQVAPESIAANGVQTGLTGVPSFLHG